MNCKPTYKGVRYNSLEELKSSVLTPQKKQIQELYSQYLQSLNKSDINPILQDKPSVITSNDKIVWGHPAIGKTTMLESNLNAFIDWDNEFNRKRDNWIANKSNTVIGTPEYKQARNEYMINYNNHEDYISFVTDEWNKTKTKANKENKILIASPHMLLNLFPNDFDKVITMHDKTFMDRAVKRSGGDEVNSKLWKEGINQTLKSVDKSKIIETDKYLSDLFDNTKQEQVKKFVELQERLNNKEFVEGTKNVYDNSKELQELGTQEQYIDFIAKVALGIVRNPSSGEFNDSKVIDVVYHGTDKDFKDFDKSFKKSNRERALSRDDLGFYFTKQKEFADIFKDEDFNKTFFKDKKLSTLSAIVNVNSPYSIDNIFELNDVETYASEKDFDLGNGTFTKSPVLEEIENNFESGKNDALITKGGLYKDEAIYDYVIVKNPEQIHILSSKQDTEGFKQHVSTIDDTSENNKDTYYQKVTDTVSPFEQMSKIDQVAFEKTVRDLAARMSDRIGIPYKIINDTNEKYKGKLSNGTAYINLAYCDMSTISHEVLGHSIIRALKNKSELSFKEQLNKEVYQGNIEKKC